ncbi:MAG: cytochrome P450 [Wenyingzhuangia sp.]|jgi:cytochrome P450|uniref:cytochrome P450 n=1 Tax=Wenyingzhuangia sp. TaxID=1964193 RepID=UPI002767BA4B|nr:cytochrome P450 [Saprospiraceae bacterium]
MMKQIPVYNKSVFSTKSLASGLQLYKDLSALGDVIYLKKDKVYAVTSYAAHMEVLNDPETFTAAQGVALNKQANEVPEAKVSVLMSEGDEQRKRKAWYMKPITQRKLKDIKDNISESCENMVQDLAKKNEIEVVKDFAAHIPLEIVSKMIGYPEKGSKKLLDWAFATFNTFGPNNLRTLKSLPGLIFGLSKYSRTLNKDNVLPGSWSHATFKAIEEGKLGEDEGRAIVMGYAIPSLDTTIQSATSMFELLAKHPEKFNEIKENPDLIRGVVNEAIRLSSPVRGFSRVITKDTEVAGYQLEKDKRVLMLWSCANRDPKKYPNPDEFDIHRNPEDHLGWGYGNHRCAGEHLARLEMEELLKALCKHASKLEVSNSEPFLNNTLQGYKSMSGKIIPA